MLFTLTFILTIIGGAITFSLGQFIMKACLEPALTLKRQIGTIAYDLDFYANAMYGENSRGDEAREIFRRHACRLRESINTIIWYRFLEHILNLPSASNIYEASSSLIGHSNCPREPRPDMHKPRSSDIKRLLRIVT